MMETFFTFQELAQKSFGNDDHQLDDNFISSEQSKLQNHCTVIAPLTVEMKGNWCIHTCSNQKQFYRNQCNNQWPPYSNQKAISGICSWILLAIWLLSIWSEFRNKLAIVLVEQSSREAGILQISFTCSQIWDHRQNV